MSGAPGNAGATPAAGAMMPRARLVTLDVTADISAMMRRLGGADPFELLVDQLRPLASQAIDALQVAALLESSGMTDRMARVRYGFADVFDLAQEIHRLVGVAQGPPHTGWTERWSARLRDVGHGIVYLLPAALAPVGFTVLGSPGLIPGVLAVGALGWVWSGATAWLAYRMRGDSRPGSAGELMRWSGCGAVAVAAAVGAVAADVTGVGYGLVVLALALMAYQMSAAVMMIYRREEQLLAAMLPGAVGAVAYLMVGPAATPAAVASGLGSVAASFALAMRLTFGASKADGPRLPESLRGLARPLVPVVAFAALSAVFFLAPQARHLPHRFDVAVALLPLMVGMGVVEWRARTFADRARAVLAGVGRPRRFVVGVWRILLSGLVACFGAVAGLAVLLLVALDRSGGVSAATVVMCGAAVVLAGAYYLGFLLANLGRYGWLCGSLLACVGVYVVGGAGLGGSALADTTAFLGAAALLLVLYVVALSGRLGQACQYG